MSINEGVAGLAGRQLYAVPCLDVLSNCSQLRPEPGVCQQSSADNGKVKQALVALGGEDADLLLHVNSSSSRSMDVIARLVLIWKSPLDYKGADLLLHLKTLQILAVTWTQCEDKLTCSPGNNSTQV